MRSVAFRRLKRSVQKMKTNFLVLTTIFCFLDCDSKLLDSKKKDDVLELISKAGYSGEAHRIETVDGYLLKVHRVLPKAINLADSSEKVQKSKKKPVFLMHGISATAADFLVTGPDQALAYLLVDHEYDVWLGNARGSKHSMRHTNISSDARDFWNFSWHEIGFYDLAAMLDYMLTETHSSQAFYAGHSQGSTSLLVLLSSRPEFNQKLSQVHLMAPSAFRKKTPRLQTITQLLEYLDSVDNYRYLDLTSILRFQGVVSKALCLRKSRLATRLCNRVVLLLVGNGQKEVHLDTKILPNLMEHLSTRVSIMQLTHYYQNMKDDKFRMFDHKKMNLLYYNSSTPPEYDLDNIVAPTYLYHASKDMLISDKGFEHLAKSLPNVRQVRTLEDWNHIDFVYGKHSRDKLYINILQNFESSP